MHIPCPLLRRVWEISRFNSSNLTKQNKKMSGSCIPKPELIHADSCVWVKGKKRSTFSLLKTALFIIRGPKKTHVEKVKSNENQVVLTENLTKLVGSMRPLHLQDNIDSPTPSLPSLSPSPSLNDLLRPRATSSPSASSTSPSWGKMSQYTSANNLQELDECDEEEEDPDELFEATIGDDMIDSKAEQFIAQFYQQMKLQKVSGYITY